MTTETEKFYTIARTGLPEIAAATRLHSGRFPDVAWAHKLISQSLNSGGTTEPGGFYGVIERAMLEIDGKAPEGNDAVVDAAYNVLHSLFWCDTPAPANKPQLRGGQDAPAPAAKTFDKTRAAMAEVEQAYARMQAVFAAESM